MNLAQVRSLPGELLRQLSLASCGIPIRLRKKAVDYSKIKAPPEGTSDMVNYHFFLKKNIGWEVLLGFTSLEVARICAVCSGSTQ